MNNSYIGYKNRSFIVTDKEIKEKPYNEQDLKIAKLENMLELLEKELENGKKKADSLKRGRRYDYTILMMTILLSVFLPTIYIKTDFIFPARYTVSTELFGIISNKVLDMVSMWPFFAATAVFSIYKAVEIIRNAKKMGGVETQISFLSEFIEDRKEKLKDLKKKSLESRSRQEEKKSENLNKYNKELEEKIRKRLEKIYSLGAMKRRLLREYRAGNLEHFLKKRGYSEEEIAESKKLIIFQSPKRKAI